MLSDVEQGYSCCFEDKFIPHGESLLENFARLKSHSQAKPKSLRLFTTGEVAQLTGLGQSTLRTLDLEGKGPRPKRLANNHRAYTLKQINEIRDYFSNQTHAENLCQRPHRKADGLLQILTIVSFPDYQMPMMTCAHLAQYFALKGYRVLALDLNPAGTLSAIFNTPSTSRPLNLEQASICKTYFDGVDLVSYQTGRQYQTGRKEGLEALLQKVGHNYDLVLIDTAGLLNPLCYEVLEMATGLVFSLAPKTASISALMQYLLMMGTSFHEIFHDEKSSSKFKPAMERPKGFLRYLIAGSNNGSLNEEQAQIAALVRHLFQGDVLHPVFMCDAVFAPHFAGAKTLYDLEAGEAPRRAYKAARHAIDDVGGALVDLVRAVAADKTHTIREKQ